MFKTKVQQSWILAAIVLFGVSFQAYAQSTRMFQSPNNAVEALFAAIKTKDDVAVISILGETTGELVLSGDDVQDEAGCQ